MKTSEIIQLNEGDKITVNKKVVGFSIEGPAMIVVVREEAVAQTTSTDAVSIGC